MQSVNRHDSKNSGKKNPSRLVLAGVLQQLSMASIAFSGSRTATLHPQNTIELTLTAHFGSKAATYDPKYAVMPCSGTMTPFAEFGIASRSACTTDGAFRSLHLFILLVIVSFPQKLKEPGGHWAHAGSSRREGEQPRGCSPPFFLRRPRPQREGSLCEAATIPLQMLCRSYFSQPAQLPEICILPIFTVGAEVELRMSRSLPMASMFWNMSRMLLAIVICETG